MGLRKSRTRAAPGEAPPLARLARSGGLRLAVGTGAAAAIFWLSGAAGTFPPHDRVLAAMMALPVSSWALSLALAALSYAAVAEYDRVVHRCLRTDISPARARRTGAAASAIGQAAGLGPLSGTFVRWMLLPELSFGRTARISGIVALSFFSGWAVVTGAALVLWAEAPLDRFAPFAAAGLAAAGALVLACRGMGRANLRDLLTLVALVAADTISAAAALAVFLPGADHLPALLAPFLVALGAGLVVSTPAGLGGFDAVLLATVGGVDPADLVAAIVAYRLVYVVLPAALAGAMILGLSLRRRAGAEAGFSLLDPPRAAPLAALAAVSGPAEALLLRQGHLGALVHGDCVQCAVPAGPALVAMFPPFGSTRARRDHPPIATLVAAARQQGRFGCLYKVAGRQAAAARRAGWPVIPVAREAVIRPLHFAPERPDCATLRRKLRRARRSGIRVVRAEAPPIADLAAVNRAWAAAHGGERGFSTGRFAPDYVAGQRLWLAWQGTELAGFVTFHAAASEWTLDLMRQRPGAPDGTMHSLIAAAIADAAAEAVPRLSLSAAAPDPAAARGTVGRLVAWMLMRRQGGGLSRFKESFAPRWEPRYLSAPDLVSLIRAGRAVAGAIRHPAPLPQRGRPAAPDATSPSAAAPDAGGREATVAPKRAAA
ncbi:MAG: phosphatidylglycerol lysyltransferase domain-containing protein [Pseudomonadota bacterium]